MVTDSVEPLVPNRVGLSSASILITSTSRRFVTGVSSTNTGVATGFTLVAYLATNICWV